MDYLEKFNLLKCEIEEDAACQIEYALQLNSMHDGEFDSIIEKAINSLSEEGDNKTKRVEEILDPLKALAKKATVICVAHAHIDMNWLWGYDETVAITLSTIETMLSLMDAYPEFTFSQSQASVYEIVASFRPDLIEKIKKRIKEGRWEVTAGAFVECDKNMTSTQSQINQVKVTKEYLSKLLDISPDSLKLDFEPDTFGHNAFVPEILSKTGIKYYYHCRGNNVASPFYYWKCNNAKILVYREPQWYNFSIERDVFMHVPDFCKRHNVDKVLKVYGVGNHGGGATARDIERIIHLKSLPIMPNIKFGNYLEFYEYLSSLKNIPVITGEQNPIFSGCYSSQSLIKHANAENERFIQNAELFSIKDKAPLPLALARRNVLFNQFHDILPGSGKESTRIHALALSQQTKAVCGAAISKSLSEIIKSINTAPLFKTEGNSPDRAVGAGVGHYANKGVYLPNYSSGSERAFIAFNPTNVAKKFPITLELWDYESDVNNLEAVDDNAQSLNLEVSATPENYWSHNLRTIYCEAIVPAYGYTTILLRQKKAAVKAITYPPMYERMDIVPDYTFENEFIRAKFDTSCNLISFIDKRNGKEIISTPSNFCYCVEDGTKFMSAWSVGSRAQKQMVNEKLTVHSFTKTELKTTLLYTAEFNSSVMRVNVTLFNASDALQINASIDFFEKGVFGKTIPRLDYTLNTLNLSSNSFLNHLGLVERGNSDSDVSALCLAQKKGKDYGIMLAAEGKYGFRATENTLGVCLLRASFDPDPLPEYGTREINLFISGSENTALSAKEKADCFFNGIKSVAATKSSGELKTTDKILDLKNAYLSGRERLLDGELLTLLNLNDNTEICTIKSFNNAAITDFSGTPIKPVLSENGILRITLEKNSVNFVKIFS